MLAGLAALGCSGDPAEATHVPIASEFPLVFSPVYSAYDGVHDFRVPVAPGDDTVVDRWEVVGTDGVPRDDVVEITDNPQYGGVTLKMRKAGDFFVLAHAGQRIGCSELHVTAGQADQWTIGEARYQELYVPTLPKPDRIDTPPEMFSCPNCHGDGPSSLASEYTPLQIGGLSDDGLVGLWTSGARPSHQPISTNVICEQRSLARTDGPPKSFVAWFHVTSFTQQESSALIQYMRSIPLRSQGSLDLGGVPPRN